MTQCDSGVALPPDGKLQDEYWTYHVAPCGYVTRFTGPWKKYGQRTYERHMQRCHPARWAELQKIHRMSED